MKILLSLGMVNSSLVVAIHLLPGQASFSASCSLLSALLAPLHSLSSSSYSCCLLMQACLYWRSLRAFWTLLELASANPVFFPQGTNTSHRNQMIVTDTVELHRAAQQLAKSSQHSIDMASMVHSCVVPVLLSIFHQKTSAFLQDTFLWLHDFVQGHKSSKSL